jgi:hypothetical protein
MGMGDDDLAQREAVLLEPGQNLWKVIAGIDDDGFACDLVPEDGAIAAQRTNGKTFKNHGSILDRSNRRLSLVTMQTMRVYAAVGALLGWFALALQLYLMLVRDPAGMLSVVITYFSFFTILTNFLVALVFTAAALRPRAAWGEFLLRPSLQASTAVYIAIVGMVYQLLLRHLWNPQGAQWVADVLLHSIIPVGYVLYWWLFAPRDKLSWKNALGWLVYPGAYLVYTLARGAVSGLYPYPFVDVGTLGYGGVLARAAGLMLVFLGMGLLIVAIARWKRNGHQA